MVGNRLLQRRTHQYARELVEHRAVIGRPFEECMRGRDGPSGITRSQGIGNRRDPVAIDRAEHLARGRGRHHAAAERDQLVEQRQAVAHAAVRRMRDRLQRGRLEGDAFGSQDLRHSRGDRGDRQALQVELQAARQHGHRQLLRIGGREQELDVRWRLLERLQQRIEGMLREHVHFIDEIHLAAAGRGRVLHVLEQLARVVDLGARRGIDLDQVDEAALVDGPAGRTRTAWFGRHPGLAVQALREDARDGRLADTARAREQERMVHAVVGQRVRQRPDDVLLPHEVGEAAGAPFACECGVAHELSTGGGPHQPTPRHPTSPLPLLPSGPGGVCGWSSRGNRCEPP
ncbi:MAG: hypothetical protein CMLOHMNK_01750 [Steroidobacteraceae bacterium]|nr:hypothetical protein [Steroidobacteraceae bacterium]